MSRPEMKEMIEDMKMVYATTLEEAMALAKSWGKESVSFIPNGISVIVKE